MTDTHTPLPPMSPFKNTNKFISDYLPPALVKDWRQCFRSRSSVALFILLELAGWLIFACMVAGAEPSGLPQLDSLGDMLYVLGLFALCIIIPFRAGSTVAADARVQSSNFLMLTPLSARRIVWGTWSSTALMVLLAALLSLPLLFVRRAMMTSFPQLWPWDMAAFNRDGLMLDGMMLAWLVLVGWVMAAFCMFTSVLPRILRVLMLLGGGLVVMDVMCARSVAELFGLDDVAQKPELFPLGLYVLDAVLLLLLFLELSRRHYAAPAENCSRAVRLLAPLPMLVYGAQVALSKVYGWEPLNPEGQFNFAIIYLFIALLSDALMPNYAMPAHAYRLWRGLPAWFQKPGFVPSTICLALGAFFVGLPELPDACSAGSEEQMMKQGYHALYVVLNVGFSLMFCLLITDCFCRRAAAKRPLVFGVAALACYLTSLCIMMPLEDESLWELALPVYGSGYSWRFAAQADIASACMVDGAAFLILLLLLVCWRARARQS